LSYSFTSEELGRTNGAIPKAGHGTLAVAGKTSFIAWTFRSNLYNLARCSLHWSGFFNASPKKTVVRSLPLIAQYRGTTQSLSLAMFGLGGPAGISPGFPTKHCCPPISSVWKYRVESTFSALAIPVDGRVATLIPFRGRGEGLLSLRFRLRCVEGQRGRWPAKSRGEHHGPGLLDLRSRQVQTCQR
jgi:adenylate cyclase